jgi:hypothetical protein
MDPNILTQQTQNETHVAQPQSVNQIPSSGSEWKWILLIIILLIIGGGAYYLGINKNNFFIQNQQKTITPAITQAVPTPTPLPTIEPGKPIDTTNWAIFKDSATSLSLKHPVSWQIIEGSKSANTATYAYEYLKLSGKEGSITFIKANQLGGGCNNWRDISINGATANTCYSKPSGNTGDESWGQIYMRPFTYINESTSNPKNFAFMINATAHQSLAQNRDVILQILDTISGVKIPAN